MTNISKMLPAMGFVIAAALVALTSAFKEAPKSKGIFADHYIRYDGPNNTDAQIELSSNWVDLGTGAPSLSCNESSGVVCYVKYAGDLAAFQSYVSNKTLSDLQSQGLIQDYREE